MNTPVPPFHILKEVIAIRDSKHKYIIDEDGYGTGIIENYRVTFQVNTYGEILVETIKCSPVK
jgi:hypothetical protein